MTLTAHGLREIAKLAHSVKLYRADRVLYFEPETYLEMLDRTMRPAPKQVIKRRGHWMLVHPKEHIRLARRA